MHVHEAAGGAGELRAGSVALRPRCALDGAVTHGGGQRYRAVSITGTWTGLSSYVDGAAADALAAGPQDAARELGTALLAAHQGRGMH